MELTKKEFLAKVEDYPDDTKIVIDYFDFGEADYILVSNVELRINKKCPDCIILRAVVC